MNTLVQVKVCRGCNKEKDILDFPENLNICKVCKKEERKEKQREDYWKDKAETPKTKVCSNCEVEKAISAFYKRLDSKDGTEGVCIFCRRRAADDRADKNESIKPPETQVCNECGTEKPWTDYYQHLGFSTGIEAKCKECKRKKRVEQNAGRHDPKIAFRDRIKCLYGLSMEEYTQILIDQDYKCATCPEPHTEDRKLFIDHIHYRGVDNPNVGKVRGMCCNRCNSVIGSMQENIEWLENMIKYLKKEKLYGGRRPKI